MLNNIFNKRLFALTVCLLIVQNIYSQQSIFFSQLSVDDGLSQSDINTIFQSTDGYMWFGTHDGLNKYDGYNFTHYKPDNKNSSSISSNLIFSITGDKKGNLWIGSTGSGLSFFNAQTEKFINFKHNPNNTNSPISNFISTSFYDSKDRLWIGTNKGLEMIDCTKPVDSLTFNHINLNQNNNGTKDVHSIYEDSQGVIYIGVNKSIYTLNKNQKNLNFSVYDHGIKLIDNNNIKKILKDKFNRLVIGTSDGVYIKIDQQFKKIANLSCSTIESDNDGNIWVGTNKGLHLFSLSTIDKLPTHSNTFKNDPKSNNSLSKNIITSIYKDTSGILWIGTNGGGINKYDPYKKPFHHIKRTSHKNSISYDKIRSVFEDSNGTLWIGTEGGGLNYETKQNKTNKYQYFKQIDSSINKPFALNELNTGKQKFLLIGTSDKKQFSYIDITDNNNLDNKKVVSIPNINTGVFAIEVDHKNYVWVGTYNSGVFVYQYKNKKFNLIKHYSSNVSPNSIANNIIRYIFQDSNKNLWFATGNGLSKLNYEEFEKETSKFTSYFNDPSDQSSLTHNYILSIYENKKGDLWFGTFGGGLNKLITDPLDKDARFKAYNKNDGLPNNVIKGILEDEQGYLWLSSNMGLSKFDTEQEIFKNYNTHDGLQSNEFQELACYKRTDGEIIFGGINGLNAFYADKIKDNPCKPKAVITNIFLFNKELKIGKTIDDVTHLKNAISNTQKITFNYNQNNISFEFSGLQYSSPGKNQYAHILSGFEKKWNYTNSNRRMATYTNLAPGIYTFKVKASNGDGVWNNETRNIVIEITPPFWRTIWAYMIYVFLIIFILISIWKFTIIKTEKKHELELEHLEKEKHEELQHMKMEFFTNISHEFRTPLTLIKGPLEYLQKKGKELDHNVINHQYQLMDKNTNYLLRLVTQLLDFQKMDRGQMGLTIYEKNISKFIREVAQPFIFISEKNNINYTIRTENDDIYCYFSPDALEKAMNNLLSNAFKFCPEGGTVDVYVYIKKTYTSDKLTKKSVYNRVVIEVKDSGSGITDSKKERIFKRFYSNSAKELANPTGTGIGLSYTKSLIDLHQGTIVVVDNELGGTTFAVNIPQEKKAYRNKTNITFGKKEDKNKATNAYVASTLDVSVVDEKNDEEIIAHRPDLPIILVVDDNKDIRTFIKQSLKDRYNILEAENGIEGYELAKTKIPNIIISDFVMPEMDGAEFCKKCKNTAEISHIPFILLTAKTSKENEFEGLQSGADDYITKPFNLELLELKIKNIIGKRNKLRKKFNQEIILKPEEVTVTSADEIFLEKAMEVVEKNMMNTEFSVEMLVQEMSVSRSNLYLKLKEITGLSSSEFIRSIRLKRAVQLLESSDLSVKEIMYMTGFNSPSYFAKCFKKQFKMTPSDYISKNNIDIKKG